MAYDTNLDEQTDINILKIELLKSKEDLGLAEKALTKTKQELSVLQSEKFELEDQLVARDEKVQELQQQLSNISQQRHQTISQNDDIFKQVKHLEDEITKKGLLVKDLEASLLEKNEELKHCNFELNQSIERSENLNHELRKQQDENSHQKNDIKSLEEINENLEAELSKLNQKLSKAERLQRNNKSFAEEYREREQELIDVTKNENSFNKSVQFVKVSKAAKSCGAVPNCDGKGNTNSTSKTHRKPEYCPYRKEALTTINEKKKQIPNTIDSSNIDKLNEIERDNLQNQEELLELNKKLLKNEGELTSAFEKIDSLCIDKATLEREIEYLKREPSNKLKLLFKQDSKIRALTDEQRRRIVAVVTNEIDGKSKLKIQDFLSKIDHIESFLQKSVHYDEICNVCAKAFASKNGVSIHKASMEKLSIEEVLLILYVLINQD